MFNKEFLNSLRVADWGASTEAIPQTYPHFLKWIEQENHKPLTYLDGARGEKRSNLKNFFPEYKMSLTFLFDYASEKYHLNNFYKTSESNGLKVASYALGFEGLDYHHLLKDYLLKISEKIKESYPSIEISLAMDIHPVLDRDLAVRSGLGWFGKNSMLISKEHGSFVMIGSILLSDEVDLKRDTKLEADHCGQCRLCIDACPTLAISDERTIITNKCISTYTIEIFKDDTSPPIGFENASGEIFGCDICQDVCPWNKRVFRLFESGKRKVSSNAKTVTESFLVNAFMKDDIKLIISKIMELSNNSYKKFFRGTSFERLGKKGLLKNLNFWNRE